MPETTLTFPDPSIAGIHEIVPGSQIQWLREGRIVRYYFENMRPEAIDAFVAADEFVAGVLLSTQPLLLLNDFTHPSFLMTSYLRTQIEKIIRRAKNQERVV